MNFDVWEPIYQEILQDFGFSRARDEEAALLLSQLLPDSEKALGVAGERVRDRSVLIFGNAPSLAEEVEGLAMKGEALIAADGATAVLLRKGILPDIIVTDLDGPFPEILKANQRGSMVVVHAHGDNLDALRRFVPQLKNVIGTVQCRPPAGLATSGGLPMATDASIWRRHWGQRP